MEDSQFLDALLLHNVSRRGLRSFVRWYSQLRTMQIRAKLHAIDKETTISRCTLVADPFWEHLEGLHTGIAFGSQVMHGYAALTLDMAESHDIS